MTDMDFKRLLLGSTLLASLAAAPAWGQGAPETMDEDTADGVFEQVIENEEREEFAEELVDGDEDEVVVTGSRLRKDTFTSITPLQVIDTDFSAEQGLFNPTEILQGSTASSGQQIDTTFGGFVLDNGPGSETVNLRGLGAGRSLVLIDGRRVSPAGVEGAPSQPSINLIPQTFVDQYDILLDGASSVYGSDAVAGVVNAILKRDFDGLEVDFRGTLPEQSNGESYTLGASYGVNSDRGFIGVQGEYRFQNNFKIGDRDFLNGCETYLERDENGNIRTTRIDRAYENSLVGLTSPEFDCRQTSLLRRVFIDDGAFGFGSVYYDPATANANIGPFSESNLLGVPVDADGDGVVDVDFSDFSTNGKENDLADFLGQQEQASFRVVGEYTFEGEAGITSYFDVLHSNLKTEFQNGAFGFAPTVPANNPFNPCNIAAGGTDCGLALNQAYANPNFLETFRIAFNDADLNIFGTPNCFGITPAFGAEFCTPANLIGTRPGGVSYDVVPLLDVIGDRNFNETELAQTRITLGTRGDIPGISFGSVGDVSFDVSVVHSFSEGDSNRRGIRQDRLDLSLGFDPRDGSLLPGGPCSASGLPFDIAAGCVPVNLFAPSLYANVVGNDFATQAERDYLFDDRLFATDYEQTTIDGAIQGRLFTLPGGDVRALVGAQWRRDDINSQPDNVARDGLLQLFFADGGAAGDRVTKELYGEVSLPLGLGTDGFREFNVDLAGRITDDEFYGTNETYSIKAGWRPLDSLLIRGTYGTSFRAPTVRELFLRDQSGFNTLADPCVVPPDAVIPDPTDPNAPPIYDPQLDTRSDRTLENCRLAGVDPLTFDFGGGDGLYSVEINRGGTFDLDPETSTSFTVGASFDQPFTDAFDMEVGFTYYEYDIQDTFVEQGPQGLINDCYIFQPQLQSPFCGRVIRAAGGEIDVVNAGFVNRDEDTVKGWDFNLDMAKEGINVFGEPIDLAFAGTISKLDERVAVQRIDNQEVIEEFVGDFSFPEWQGIATLSATVDKFRVNWTTNYEGSVEADQGLDQFGEPELNVPEPTNFFDSNLVFTTGGPTLGDVNAIPVSQASDQFIHSLSVNYAHNADVNVVLGVRNIFDNAPPLVSGFEVFQVNNVALGSGYDYNGRRFFARLVTRF